MSKFTYISFNQFTPYIDIFSFCFTPRWRLLWLLTPLLIFISHREKLLELLKKIVDRCAALVLRPASPCELAPKCLSKWVEPETRKTLTCPCLLLFIRVHACCIIDLSLVLISKSFICSTEEFNFMYGYSLIVANFSFASAVLFTSGWYSFANLKYAFFMSSLSAYLGTPNIST